MYNPTTYLGPEEFQMNPALDPYAFYTLPTGTFLKDIEPTNGNMMKELEDRPQADRNGSQQGSSIRQ